MKDEDSPDVTIQKARRDELPDILALLDECELPREGLAAHLSTTLVARSGNEIVGCSALELHEESALLRSVGVKSSSRSRGFYVQFQFCSFFPNPHCLSVWCVAHL